MPRRGIAPPRNDMIDGASQLNVKLKFERLFEQIHSAFVGLQDAGDGGVVILQDQLAFGKVIVIQLLGDDVVDSNGFMTGKIKFAFCSSCKERFMGICVNNFRKVFFVKINCP